MSEVKQSGKSRRTRRNVIAFGGVLAGAAFSRLGNRKAGATLRQVSCFLKGTRVLTPDGERPIEELKIGDMLVTDSGESKPIEWIGRRRYQRTSGRSWVWNIRPVRIARGALGANVPHSDLLVSQQHCVLVDGLLIGAGDLINGSSITLDPCSEFSEIEYLHIKVAGHDVILAEGAPVETMAINGRSFEAYENFVEYERLTQGNIDSSGARCAPFSTTGGRARMRSHLRSALSPWIDRRNTFEKARDRLAERESI